MQVAYDAGPGPSSDPRPLGAGRLVLAAVAILAFSCVILDVAYTRISVAVFGHHYAVLTAFVGPFGAAMGAGAAFLWPRAFGERSQGAAPDRFHGRAALISSLFCPAGVASLLVVLHVSGVIDKLSAGQFARVFALALTSAAPFALASAVFAASLRRAPASAAQLFAALAGGLAIGGVGLLGALQLGAMRAVLGVTIVACVAALLFYVAARRAGEPRGGGGLLATFALCSAVLMAGDVGAPYMRLPGVRWTAERSEFQVWSDQHLISVDRAVAGLSNVRFDGAFPRPLVDAKTQPPATPDDLAYVLVKDKGPVLVLGVGGGRELRVAFKNGQTVVYATEVDPVLVNDVMRGKYRTHSGDLLSRPELHLELSDARGYLRRSSLRFRAIVVGQGDATIPIASGAVAFTPQPLITVDAIEDELAHLTDDGVLVLTRADAEFDRLIAVSMSAMGHLAIDHPDQRSAQIDDPGQHLFACSFNHTASLLVKRAPLTKQEITSLRRHCQRSKFIEVFAPDEPRNFRRAQIAGVSPKTHKPQPALDVQFPAPPSDDRPFFFTPVVPSAWVGVLADPAAMAASQQGILLWFAVLFVGAALTLALVLALGVARRRRGGPLPASLGRGAHTVALGLGVAFLAIATARQFSGYLGHPVYTATLVLVALFLFAAVGSILVRGVDEAGAQDAAAVRAEVLVVAISAVAAIVQPLLGAVIGLPFGARLAIVLVLVGPLGLFAGAQPALAVRLRARRPTELPIFFATLAASIAFGAVLAVPLALQLGYAALWLAAGAAFLVAAVVVPAPAPSVASTSVSGSAP